MDRPQNSRPEGGMMDTTQKIRAAGAQSQTAQNDNLPEHYTKFSFSPPDNYPDSATVKGRVLGALLREEHLTHLDCWRRFGSARLSHHIYMLRGMGWQVEMAEQTVTTSDAGRAASIGIYNLAPAVIANAGERGREYAEECWRIEIERRG